MSALKDAMVGFGQALRNRLRVPYNAQGQLLSNGPGGFTSRPSAIVVGFVQSDEELTFQQEQEEDFELVFNNWQRISRRGENSGDNASPSDAAAWTFNGSTGRVVQPLNTGSLTGFISDHRYNNYVLEARLSSNNGDDDHIGLCIAHARDSQGRTHILTALRAYYGRAPLVIDKNYHNNDTSEYEVGRSYNGLQWADNSTATGPIDNNSIRPGWSQRSNGILLRVTRQEDIVIVETSRNDGVNYHDEAKITFDLSLDPELEVFRGPQRYGYVCQSQPNSTFEVLDRVTENFPIVDLRTYRLYEYESGNWVVKGEGLQNLLDRGVLVPNQLHMNPITGRYYYMRGTESLDLVSVPN